MQISYTEFKKYSDLLKLDGGVYCIGEAAPYFVWLQLGGLELDTIVESSESVVDFEANLKSYCNQTPRVISGLSNYDGKYLYRESFYHKITGGDEYIISKKFTKDTILFGGEYELIGVVTEDINNESDYLEFMITDEDNVLGYGAGAVINKFVTKEWILPGNYTSANVYHREINTKDAAARVPSFLYFTLKYVSKGVSSTNDITLIERLFPWN